MNIQDEEITVKYLLYSLKNFDSEKQIGRTLFQKMMYLISRETEKDLGYEMYHYGPYSNWVSNLLELSEKNKLIDVSWDSEKGYFIKLKTSEVDIDNKIDPDNKSKIDNIIKLYGKYNTKQLSIITTALFLMDNYNIPKKTITKEVKKVKPSFTEVEIETLLKKVNIINN